MKRKTLTAKSKKNLRVAKLFIISMFFVAIAAFIAVLGCSYIGNRNFTETFYSTSSLKVNNKVRIIQISDLHNCTYGKENAKLIDRVEKLKPDIILYTGDCLDADVPATDRVLSLCEALAKVAPSYYVYGNNEVEIYYKDVMTQDSLDAKFGFTNETRDPAKLLEITDEFTQALEAVGVKVLKNSHDTVTVGETQVDVYGVLTSNVSAFWSYAGASFGDYLYTDTNNLKITAIHEPMVFEEYSPDFWGDIMLAGHTHGGTVKVPMIGPLYAPGIGLLPERGGHYVAGRYEVQGRPLIVSSGMENKNLFRINNSPELVIVDVNRF